MSGAENFSMQLNDLIQISCFAILSVGAAYLVLGMLSRLEKQKLSVGDPEDALSDVAFLFEGEKLVNATPKAKRVLKSAPPGLSDLRQFFFVYRPGFPDLEEQLCDLAEISQLTLQSVGDETQIVAEWRNGLARFCVKGKPQRSTSVQADKLHLKSLEEELETLRATTENTPFLVWRQTEDGTITWANKTYLELASTSLKDNTPCSWPPPRLFKSARLQESDLPKTDRLSLHIAGEAVPRWFECVQTVVGNDRLYSAAPANSLVSAEIALWDFVQTLTKTFAHLTTGLAVFDKQRRLALFNPALADLTSLSPEFLSSRPTLQTVLNRLRDIKMIPEPKNYKSWRRKMYDLEAAAKEGTYEESWPIASGQTYRVNGRPHPDGAVAFMIEDISAEVSLTRRYRAELEVGQTVLDSFDEAIAVFSPDGSLITSNVAYAKLWGVDPTSTLLNHNISEASRTWGETCAPSPIWGDLREFAVGFGDRSEWKAEARSKNGQLIRCRFSPLSGGATLVGFQISDDRIEPAVVSDHFTPRISEGKLAV